MGESKVKYFRDSFQCESVDIKEGDICLIGHQVSNTIIGTTKDVDYVSVRHVVTCASCSWLHSGRHVHIHTLKICRSKL